MKRGHRVAVVSVIPLLGGILWLFGSHSPTDKVYTADRQYSYYLEAYNFNKIARFVSDSAGIRYRVFVIDEITGRTVRSEYAGTKAELADTDSFGFEEERPALSLAEGGRMWFMSSRNDRRYELPRPRDRRAAERAWARQKAVEDSIRREERRIRAIADSIRWKEARREAIRRFYERPPIVSEEAARLEPVIRTWLDFYGIDLSRARKAGESTGRCFNCPSDPAEDIYYSDFGPKDDSPSLVQVSYSPDRQRYVDMLIEIEMRDGVPHDTGMYDVDQAVRLVDRREKINNLLVFNGSSDRIQDAFWKGNDVFVTVGFSRYDVVMFHIVVYDIPGGTLKAYEVVYEGDPEALGDLFTDYANEVYLPSRGIVPYRYEPENGG